MKLNAISPALEIPATKPHPVSTFSQLPDDAYVNTQITKTLFGVSSATLWRHIKRGSIPKPHKFSQRTVRFNVGELRVALAAKMEA